MNVIYFEFSITDYLINTYFFDFNNVKEEILT